MSGEGMLEGMARGSFRENSHPRGATQLVLLAGPRDRSTSAGSPANRAQRVPESPIHLGNGLVRHLLRPPATGYRLNLRQMIGGIRCQTLDFTTQELEERVMIRQRLVRQWRFPVIGAFWQ